MNLQKENTPYSPLRGIRWVILENLCKKKIQNVKHTWELESSTAGSGLCLSLHFASFTTASHNESGVWGFEKKQKTKNQSNGLRRNDWETQLNEQLRKKCFYIPRPALHTTPFKLFCLIYEPIRMTERHSSAFYDFALIKRCLRDIMAVWLSDWSKKANVCAVCEKMAGRHFSI